MRISRHILKNSFCLSEKHTDVLYAACKCRSDMSALFRKRFRLIICICVVFIKEHLSLFKDRKIIKVTLVFRNRLAKVRQKRRTNAAHIRRRRRGKFQNSVCALQNCVYKHIVHPRISIYFLHSTAYCKIFFNISYKTLIFLIDRVCKCRRKLCRLEIIVSVHSGNFFHHIVFNGNISCRTPCRRRHMHVVSVDLNIESKLL